MLKGLFYLLVIINIVLLIMHAGFVANPMHTHRQEPERLKKQQYPNAIELINKKPPPSP